jgi:hypothetical protein
MADLTELPQNQKIPNPLKLVRPITINTDKGAKKLTHLTLTPPSMFDVDELNDPMSVTASGRGLGGSFQYQNRKGWIARVAKELDGAALKQMHGADGDRIMAWIVQELAIEPEADDPKEAIKNSAAPLAA